MRKLGIAVLGLALVACGSENKKKNDDAPTPAVGIDAAATAVAPAVTVGVEHPSAFNFTYGKGAAAFKPAAKAIEAGDWAAVITAATEALAADPDHYDAQLALARARAETGDAAGIAAPLTAALAADYTGYAAELAEGGLARAIAADPALAERVDAIRQAYLDRAKGGLLLVARRTRYRLPRTHKTKVQWAATRAELYAYDRETERYLRLTHTDHSLAGWIMAPSGDELAFVSHTGIRTGGGPDKANLLGWVRVGVLDLDTLALRGKRASVGDPVRRVRLGYRAGDELVVETSAADGRWAVKSPRVWFMDRGAGKLKKSKVAFDPAEVLSVDADRVTLERATVAEIQADAEASSFRLLPTNTTVTMPSGDIVATGGYTWSPDKVHLLVRTAAHCEEGGEAGLYLVDAATGKLKNILRGASSFESRWIDNDHFVYEDDEGTLRIYDVEERTQVGRLVEKGGLALVGVAAGRGPLCTERAPESDEDEGDPDRDSDPEEDDHSDEG